MFRFCMNVLKFFLILNNLYSQQTSTKFCNEALTRSMEHHSLTEMHFHIVLCRYEPSPPPIELHSSPKDPKTSSAANNYAVDRANDCSLH